MLDKKGIINSFMIKKDNIKTKIKIPIKKYFEYLYFIIHIIIFFIYKSNEKIKNYQNKLMMMEKNTLIGLVEKIVINDREFMAKIDTGASKSSIDMELAASLKLGPIIGTRIYKNVHGKSIRPVIKIPLKIADRNMIFKFNLADRRKMRYKILIGLNILKNNFLIDPSKK